VTGSVLEILGDRVFVHVALNGLRVVAFLHKSRASNVVFVTDEMLSLMFRTGEEMEFTVRAVYPQFETVELSRKPILKTGVSNMQYGDVIDVVSVTSCRGMQYVHAPNVEGMARAEVAGAPGNVARLIPARIDRDQGHVEFGHA